MRPKGVKMFNPETDPRIMFRLGYRGMLALDPMVLHILLHKVPPHVTGIGSWDRWGLLLADEARMEQGKVMAH